MTLSTPQLLTAIARHSRALAEAAETDLRAPVEHCPGWDVAELVRHVTGVHWFWATIAAERLTEPPSEERAPAPVADDALLPTFRAGAEHLVAVLGDADQATPVWTWFPDRQDIGFITRHQVQEAAVHHWDAAHAVGAAWTMDPAAAADAVEEFLTCSLAEADDVVRIGATLPGPLVLHATDLDRTWTVRQVDPAAALTWEQTDDEPTVVGTAADLLLWTYQRADLPVGDPAVVAAFRRLSSTD